MVERKTILCVDDAPEILVFLQSCLRAAGFEVRTASNAAEGFVAAVDNAPDLIITDVIMPGESGYSLSQKLRANQATESTPILVFTVLEDEMTAINSGATAFLSKPVDEVELVAAVRAVMSPPNAQSKLERAVHRIRDRELDEAMAELNEILATGPEQSSVVSWASYYRAQIFENRGQLNRAKTSYQRLIAVHPDFWRAHSRLGKLLEQSGNYDAAHDSYAASLAHNPSQPNIEARRLALDALQAV